MATGETAATMTLPSSPPALLDHSPSNLSSPLSDVEDKDQDPDGMDLDKSSERLDTSNRPDEDDDDDSRSPSGSASDDGSNLSDPDVDDSEAETERLYDTPPKNRDITNGHSAKGSKQFTDRRDRNFEPSPSKLQQQIQADIKAQLGGRDRDSLSDEEDEADGASIASSETDHDQSHAHDALAKTPNSKTTTALAETALVADGDAKQNAAEPRKRKRSPEQSDTDQPLRKRTASVGTHEREEPDGDVAIVDDDAASSHTQTGDHSDEEEVVSTAKRRDGPADTAEEPEPGSNGTRKIKKSNGKKRKSKSPDEGGGDDGDPSEPVQDEVSMPAVEEDGVRNPEEEPGDVDGEDEPEAAHKNEEELAKKKVAWEQLTAIEKHFATFRDRLYQERLDQLNQEEAMLTGENPTHPEFLAMMQCIDARRDERLRVIELEYKLKMDVLKRRATAERAQIMSQFYQSIRESREKTLEDLGRQWYEIQHERRRYANSIPDYTLWYPSSRAQNVKNAVAYNKEVSILSGIAKHIGFPAAPDTKGADAAEVDEDFDAMHRARQASHQIAPVVHHPPFQEYGALSIGRSLGPAGEQFLEQTPWANPNHPAHHIQRQNSLQESSNSAGPSAPPGPRRHSQQTSPHTPALINGASGMQKSKSSTSHEQNRPSKIAQETVIKREPLAQSL